MKTGKELIYTGKSGERVEAFSPLIEELEAEQMTSEERSAPRRKRGGRFAGLTIGVALFATAFLLCDGMYALRATAEEHLGAQESDEGQSWLSQLLSGSFAGGQTESIAPIVTDRLPAAETSAAIAQTPSEPAQIDGSASSESETSAPETVQTPASTLTAEQLYAYSTDAVPEGMIPIVPMDLSLSGYGESFYYNDTSYTLSLTDLPASSGAIPTMVGAEVGEVSVLILHTHATEGYSEEGATYYDPSTVLARADDPATGVVAVGDMIAEILNQNGIVTLHCTVLHDKESYKDSYSRAAQTIQSYLEQYPSIRLVIDVHRDSIMTSSEHLVRPVTLVDGEAVAQVMCVVGSNAAGAAYDDWQENLSLAVRLRQALNGEYGNLCRPVYIKKSTYNQQYAPASLLLEIGSSGNSLEEAQRAAELVAEKIVKMMK